MNMSGKVSNTIDIKIYEGEKLIAQKTFQQDKIIIGRILSADLRVPNMKVSRIHALLEQMDDGHCRLTDLASSHGTFVNGERIVERILKPGDDIKLADISVRLSFSQAPLSVAPQATAAPVKSSTQTQKKPGTSAGTPKDEVAVQMSPQGAVSVSTEPREATVIRSLKDTARTRGALDPTTRPHEELEITVYWEETILNVDHYKRQNYTITLGDGMEADYIVPINEFPKKFNFIELRGGSATLFVHPMMKLSARLQGKMLTDKDFAQMGQSSIQLGGSDIAKVRIGSVHFFIMFVPEPPAIPVAPIFDQGKFYWSILFLTTLLIGGFVLMSMMFQPGIEGEVKEFPEHFRKIIVQAYKKRVEKIEKTEEKKEIGEVAKEAIKPPDAIMVDKVARRGGNEGEGARERGEEGKRGRPDAKHATGITNRPKVANNKMVQDGATKAKQPITKPGAGPAKPVEKASLLSSLKNSALGARLAKAGEGGGGGAVDGAAGNDPLDEALSGTGGGGIRSGRGSGGSGLQGTGKGGGGTAVGIGGLGTKGFGGGAKGDGVGSIPGKGEFVVSTETVGVMVLGSLSREEIERVIRAHFNEVRYCYQAELQRNPGLSGKVTLKWSIVESGRVEAEGVKENTTGSSGLAQCMLARLRQWQFPAPRGGSKADVDYPWLFKPEGS
jgi:pSer/pThr/pTyr-binding forkhead associated (FHA) protein